MEDKDHHSIPVDRGSEDKSTSKEPLQCHFEVIQHAITRSSSSCEWINRVDLDRIRNWPLNQGNQEHIRVWLLEQSRYPSAFSRTCRMHNLKG